MSRKDVVMTAAGVVLALLALIPNVAMAGGGGAHGAGRGFAGGGGVDRGFHYRTFYLQRVPICIPCREIQSLPRIR
jgi:hypothetical protein